jgi:hypothetical protein
MASTTTTPITTPGAPSEILNFIISARDLPMKDRGLVGATIQDPFVKMYAKNSANKEFTLIEETKPKLNEPNPDWFDQVISFEWLKGTGQIWRFEVLDFDILPKDDPMGYIDVDVDNFVMQKNQQFTGKLSTGHGSLLIQKTIPTKFRLSARNLPKLDAFTGASDPFVKCFWSVGSPDQSTPNYNLFFTTKTIKDVENADWDEVITFGNYQPGTNQYWTFRVYDKDTLPIDDFIGEAFLEVDRFTKERKTFKLDIKSAATLIVTPA